MNWASLIGPAVVAAVISALVSTIGIWISARTARRIHTEKLAFDREEAERRFVREVGATEVKIKADSALAEKKLSLDSAFAAWKRRTELAEETLGAFYEARDVIREARSPAGFQGEGKTREREDWETEEERRSLDSYFRTVERLNAKAEFFAQLYARRYRFLALFGPEGASPYDDFFRIRWEIIVAVRMLMDTHRNRALGSLPEDRKAWEKVIGWRPIGEDSIGTRLDRAIEGIEQIFRPAIQGLELR